MKTDEHKSLVDPDTYKGIAGMEDVKHSRLVDAEDWLMLFSDKVGWLDRFFDTFDSADSLPPDSFSQR